QPGLGVLLATLDFVAGQLPAGHRIETPDARADLAVRDALDLERMQAAELGDLLEGETGIVHQPDGSGLGHQRSIHHELLALREMGARAHRVFKGLGQRWEGRARSATADPAQSPGTGTV